MADETMATAKKSDIEFGKENPLIVKIDPETKEINVADVPFPENNEKGKTHRDKMRDRIADAGGGGTLQQGLDVFRKEWKARQKTTQDEPHFVKEWKTHFPI